MHDLDVHDMSNQWYYVILTWFDVELQYKTIFNYVICILVT